MHRFSVWAPAPERVDLVLGSRLLAMTPGEDGWWHLEVGDAGPGTRYSFSLDGGPALPDPRSRYQPEGVDGPSEVVDPSGFPWTDVGWRGVPLPGAVLYELHIGTFSSEGTFDGAIAHLPHLVDLGVDVVEVMPVAEFPGCRGWGYDGVGLFAPHHAYGGPAGLDRFVDACHQAGLGVILDVVYNHLGRAGNHLARFGPYFTDRHQTPWGDALNLDGPGSDEVRRFVIDNALHWLDDHHLDGLRLDAVHALVDQAPLHLLEELAGEVRALSARLGRTLSLVAENDTNDPRLVRPPELGGYGLDAAWADDWHHAVHRVLTGETTGYYAAVADPASLPKALRQAWVHDGTWSATRRRRHGRSPSGLSPSAFVVSAQNHDQVGNRAAGERLSTLTSEGRLHVVAALLLTTPFTPMLFQGEEWGARTPFLYFTDHRDPELAEAVVSGRRDEFAAFGWSPEDVPDPQDPTTYERSVLDWQELRRPDHQRLLRWHRHLLGLRRSVPALTDPRLPAAAELEAGRLRWTRGPVRLLANLGAEPIRELLDGPVLAASPGVEVERDQATLDVDSVVVWSAADRASQS